MFSNPATSSTKAVVNFGAKVMGNARKHFPLLENYVSILEKPLFMTVLRLFCTPTAT